MVGGRNEVRDAAEERSGGVLCVGAVPLDSPAAARETRARGRLMRRTDDRGTSSSCLGRSVEDVMKTRPRSRIEGTTVLPVGCADASDVSPGTTSTGGLPAHHKDNSQFLPGPRIKVRTPGQLEPALSADDSSAVLEAAETLWGFGRWTS